MISFRDRRHSRFIMFPILCCYNNAIQFVPSVKKFPPVFIPVLPGDMVGIVESFPSPKAQNAMKMVCLSVFFSL